MSKVRLAIIGCGDIARFTAMFGRLSRRIQLAAACDVDAGRAQAFALQYKIPQVETDYAAVLRENLDAVYLAVPHHLHAGMLRQALSAGKAVLVEKPVTRTLAEGLEIASLAEQNGGIVAVNYQYRYDAAVYAMARAVQNGDLGAVNAVRINVPWRREADYFAHSAWHRTIASAGGGTLITQGSHFLDAALWALGGRPVSAVGFTARRKFRDVEVEDLAQGIIEMDSGALVQICSSMAAAVEQAVKMEIYGEKATAVYTDRPWPQVRFFGARVRPEPPPVWGLHALQRSLEAFGAWVQGGLPHLVDARSSLPALAVVEAIYRSAQTGQKTPVTETRSGPDGVNH